MLTPFDLFRAGFALTRLGVEAQSVIWMRMMGLSGAWNTPFDESYRMMREKPQAFFESAGRGVEAAMRGKLPPAVVMASVEPLSREAAENRQRLAKRGFRR